MPPVGRLRIRPRTIMFYIDIHTHNIPADDRIAIVNSSTEHSDSLMRSAGMHPWDIQPCPDEQINVIERASALASVVAIGECGIDKLKSPASIKEQKRVFEAQALIAEKSRKPLIIHCVKAQEEIIAIKRNIKPSTAWIIHGFRGKPEQAAQLLKEGFYLSYGEKFNAESLAATPPSRLFIESDTSSLPIKDIYKNVADILGISTEALATQIAENIERCGIIIDQSLQKQSL